MLYTRKGDSGSTKVFNSKPGVRISKSSCQTETLGALDELNSFLGLIKVKISGLEWSVGKKKPAAIIHWIQNCLFIIQAEIAGADKKIGKGKVDELEKIIDVIEKELPPIKTFFISGSTELSALLDIARTLARKAERRVVGGAERSEFKIGKLTLAYLNRLSSLLYALARLSAYKSGINEESPTYR
jgi:cob(I)alamin adenosyltransferase